MAAPLTIRATGYFIVSRGGTSAGEAVLRMKTLRTERSPLAATNGS